MSVEPRYRRIFLYDENGAQYSATNPLPIDILDISDGNIQSFEDDSFVTGDSPVTIDCNAALSRNATQGYIINDGAGNFTVAFSTDSINWGDEVTVKKNEILNFSNISVDSIRITWITNSAYRGIYI